MEQLNLGSLPTPRETVPLEGYTPVTLGGEMRYNDGSCESPAPALLVIAAAASVAPILFIKPHSLGLALSIAVAVVIALGRKVFLYLTDRGNSSSALTSLSLQIDNPADETGKKKRS